MRQKQIIVSICVILALLCPILTWAGDTYYKNLSITVNNPEPAKGRVYLMPYHLSDTSICKVSNTAKLSSIKGFLSDSEGKFVVDFYALPNDGYVFSHLAVPPADPNEYEDLKKWAYLGWEGRPVTPIQWIVDDDTTSNCIKSKPKNDDFSRPVTTEQAIVIFLESKKSSVRNNKAGSIASVVKSSRHGEDSNDLIVTGPLNKDDFKYLNHLSQTKELIRLDLSGASFSYLPDSAFYESDLYELKLPSNIKAVGNYAFAYSIGLKPVKLPEGITKGKNTIEGCSLMNLLGVKEESTHDDDDDDYDVDDLLWLLGL